MKDPTSTLHPKPSEEVSLAMDPTEQNAAKLALANAFVLAASQGHTAMVIDAIAKGAPVEHRCDMPRNPTALMMATQYGHPETVAALLPHANANATNDDRHTALMLVCLSIQLRDSSSSSLESPSLDAEECARLLLPHSNPLARDLHGRDALMCAATRGSAELCKIIASTHDPRRADDRDGKTALGWACAMGNMETALFLASISDLALAELSTGRAAAQIARDSKYPDLALALESMADRQALEQDLGRDHSASGTPLTPSAGPLRM